MKKIICAILGICLLTTQVFADTNNCDWSQIKANSDGTFTYNKTLHLCVGQLVQDFKIKDQQIQDLNKAIQLKDLALTQSDDRAQLWMKTSGDLENRLQKVDSMEKTNEWLYFGLGVATTFLAAYGASQLIKH